MADQKYIVTQTQLGPLKLALAQEAESLNSHLNDSMSKSHGFEVVQGPVQDAYGNRLVEYRNSHNDIVSTYQLKMTLGALTYYAPLQLSVLGGQTISPVIPVSTAQWLQPGPSYWVTDFTTGLTSDAQSVMTNLLLPHTRRSYWEAHGGLKTYPQVTLDSAGYVVGTDIIEMIIGSTKVLIPACKRLGGPPQTPRITLQPIPATSYAGDGQGQPAVGFHAIATGTLPMQFQWQYAFATTGPWTDLVLNVQVSSLMSTYSLLPNIPAFPPSGTGTDTSFGANIFSGGESGPTVAFYIRCKFFTVQDSVTLDSYTTPVTITCSDSTGCFLCTMAYRLDLVPTDIYNADKRWVHKHLPRSAIEGYWVWALPLSRWLSRKENHGLRDWVLKLVLCWMYHVAYLAGKHTTPNWKGRLMLWLGMPGCCAVGYAHRLWRWIASSFKSPERQKC